MTRFDNADLDRLFSLLGSDLPDDAFDAQLHAALVAESVPVARSRWKRWGRVGAGVALAAIPLAAAAAVGRGWATAPAPGENVNGQTEQTAPEPAGRPISGSLLMRPTMASFAAASAEREVSQPEPVATQTVMRSRDEQKAAATDAVKEMLGRREQPAPDASSSPVALDTPRIERVQLVAAHASPTHAGTDPPSVGSAAPTASSTPPRSGAQREPAQREQREQARERRRSDAVNARERRHAGPHSAR